MPATRVNIDYVKQHPDTRFETVCIHYGLELKTGSSKAGQRTALCPFHDDHKASLAVNVDRKIFQCFACEAKGNILDFVMKMEELNARQGAVQLAIICGIDPSGRPDAAKPSEPERKLTPAERLKQRGSAAPAPAERSEPEPPKEAQAAAPDTEPGETQVDFQPYTRALNLDTEHPYLKERGVSPEAIDTFEIGYCRAGFQKGRIAIRLHDPQGEPIGYAGRWADSEVPENKPRFLIPKNLPKRRMLYNFHRLPPDITQVTIVESYWSVFRIHELEHPVVSPMGRSISPEQIELLRHRGITHVRLLFDGDEAGQNGLHTAVLELVKHFHVKAPEVPDGFKPHRADRGLLNQYLLG